MYPRNWLVCLTPRRRRFGASRSRQRPKTTHFTASRFAELEPRLMLSINDGALTGTETFTFVAGAQDVLTIDSPTAGVGRISGTSDGAAFEAVTFTNYKYVVIDTATRDTGSLRDDLVRLESALSIAGLESLTIITGAGRDTVDLAGLSGDEPFFIAVDGGADGDTLVGATVASLRSSWTVTGPNAGSLDDTISFAGVENLTGARGVVDSFTVAPAGRLDGSVTGQADDGDSLSVQLSADASAQSLTHLAAATANAGSVSRNGVAAASYAGISSLIDLEFTATSAGDAIRIARGATAGTIEVTSTNPIATFGKLTVSHTERTAFHLDAGFGDDSITITASAVDAILEGGEFSIVGNTGTNTLTSLAAKNAWNIESADAGTLGDRILFTSIQNLVGGDLDDSFNFADGASLAGTVDGGGGHNALDYSDWTTAIAVNIGSGAVTGATAALHFDRVIGGSAIDTLTGPATNTVWRVTDENTGRLSRGDTTVLDFSGVENLTGAAADRDVFIVEQDGSVTGTLTGSAAGWAGLLVQSDTDDSYTIVNPQAGGGQQSIDLHGKQVAFIGLNPLVRPTTATAATLRAGDVAGGFALSDGANGSLRLTNVNGRFYDAASAALVTELDVVKPSASLALVLGDADTGIILDTVTTPPAISIQAGSGLNALYVDDVAHEWMITGVNAGSVSGYGAAVTFNGIGTLVGGSANDTFVFASNTAKVNGIDGGTGGTDTLDYSAVSTGVAVALGVGNANIDSVIGGTGVDTLVGVTDDNVWQVHGTNAGTVTTTRVGSAIQISNVTFTGFENLVGSVSKDDFYFADGGSVAGFVDGSAGENSLDFHLRTAAVTVNLNAAAAGGTTAVSGGVRNMTDVVGTTHSDTLLGPDIDATWEITGTNAGSIDRVRFDVNGVPFLAAVSFTGFENLTGAAGVDDGFIVMAGGSVGGTIAGGSDGSGELAIEDPQHPGTIAIVKPDATGGGTIAANTIYANTAAVTFSGMQDPFLADTSAAGVIVLRGSVFGGSLTVSQALSGDIVVTNTSSTQVFWSYSSGTFVGNSFQTGIAAGTTRVEVDSPGSVRVESLDLPATDLRVSVDGDYVFAGNVSTHGGSIVARLPNPRNNETANNTSGTITVNPGVILSTRQTNVLGTSTDYSGSIDFLANRITIGAEAQLVSHDDRTVNGQPVLAAGGIPLTLGGQSKPASAWMPGRVYRDIPTTTNGAGSGLRVDVTTDNDGLPSVSLRTPGSGYAVGDTITVEEPSQFLTGSSSFHNGSPVALTVTSLQKLGGDISLVARHQVQAIAWSFNPIEVGVSIAASAVVKGRSVSILADADNDVLFDGSKDPMGLSQAFASPADFNSYVQQKLESVLDFLINFRAFVGVSLSKATATVTLAAGSTVEAVGGNVLTEAFANSKAKGFTLGIGYGFSYGKSEATATIDALGSVRADAGAARLNSITGNTIDVTQKTTNTGALAKAIGQPFKLLQSAGDTISISGAVTEAISRAATTVGSAAVVTATDVSLGSFGVKNVSTTVDASSENGKLGVCFLVTLDDASAATTVNGRVTATAGDVDISARTTSEKNATLVKFQLGQPVRSDLANKITAGIQLTRAIADGVAGSDDTAAAAGGLVGAGIKYAGDKNYNHNAESVSKSADAKTTVSGSSHGVIVGAFGFHKNTATAKVGGTAVVSASGGVRVQGTVLDRPVSLAQGLAAVFNDGVNVVSPGARIVGIAFDYGEYDNHSQAIVATGAAIDAGGAIHVSAHTLLPYETPWSNLNTQDSWTTGWQIPARILQHLGSDNLGANLYFSTFTQSTAIGNKKGYAVSGTIRAIDSGAEARVESGAMINQANQADPITASRNVSVTARTDVQTVNLVGNFPQILDVALGQAERKRQLSNSGEASGWGGSFSAVLYDATTQAVIESGARIRAHDLIVDADTLVKNVSVGISGGKAGETAVNGVVNHVGIDNVTLAQIGQGAAITATGKVDVTADDTPLVVNLAGGVAIGTSTGVGITVGSTVVTRDTKALVGVNSTTLGNGTFTPGTGVDAAADTIDLGYLHGYANGDRVVYSNGGDDSIGGVTDGQVYEVVRVNATTIGLKTLAGAAVPLSAPALDAGVRHTLGRVFSPATSIIGTSPATVDAIELGYAHGFHTGDAVVYGNGGDTSIGGLAHKTTYYVIVVNATTIRLAESLAKAQRGEWIDLDASVATGTSHAIAIAFRAAPVVDAAADTIAFPNAGGFHDGQKVVYRNGGGTSIGGLTDGAAYYVTRVDANRITLSTDANDRAGSVIALDPTVATGGGHALVDPTTAAAALDVGGITTVRAVNGGQFITITLAAAKAGDPPPASDDALSAEAPGGQKHGQAVSGSVSVNTVDDTTVAEIRSVSITHSGGVAVSAEHSPSIVAISGGAAISTNSSNSARNVGLAGAVTVNVIDGDTRATIVDSSLTDAGVMSVAATHSAAIVSIAAGLGGSARGSGIAGSVAVNSIDSDAVATVASSTVAGTSLAVTGTDGSSIITVAGGLAGGGKLGVGAGIAVNTIDATAHAIISGTSVDVTAALDVTATGSPAITAVAAGVAVVIASPSADPDAPPGTTRGLALAIGLAVNSITLDVQASLIGNGTDTVNAGSVAVVADDADASILAVAGGVAVGVSTSEKAGATAGAGGAAFALNKIEATAASRIADIVVTTTTTGGSGGDVTVRSHSDAEIRSYAVGGAVAGAGGGGAGGSWAIAGAGALTFNDIARDVTASISGTSRVTTPGTSRVIVTAIDESTVVTVAGGISIAVGVGGQASALGISIGASIASNTIKDRTATGGIRATVSGAAIAAGGDITVEASSTGTVTVTAFAGALAVSGSGGGTAAAASGAGASAENTITTTVLASIDDTPGRLPDHLPRVRSQGGSIRVTATDDATIDATAVGASISVAAGTKLSGALAIGVSIARNRIDSDVAARLLDADVAAGQAVAVTGTGTADITAVSVAASVSFANGASGVSLAGGGSESTNVILSGTTATVTNSFVAATGDVDLTSTNSAVIDSTVVSVAVALGFGKDLAVGVAVGAAVSRNMIGYDSESDTWIPVDVQAVARNSTIEAGNDLTITAAADKQRIDATVVAAAAAIVGSGGTGFALAGSGVSVENRIGEAVKASIDYVPNVARSSGPAGAFEAVDGFVVADVVTVSASDSSAIEAVAVGASLAGSYGTNGALGVAIGASLAHNEIRNTVTASIVDADRNNSDPTLAGVTARTRLDVSATEVGTVSASAVAASVAAAFSTAASAGLSGAGADATNVILTKTNASIEGSRVAATTGVSVVASNSADIDATIVGVAVAVGIGANAGVGAAIGVALARNFIGWELDAAAGDAPAAETRAFVRDSSITAGGSLDLTATSSQTIDATVFAGSVAIAGGNIGVGVGGAGASSINKAAMAVHAFIDGDGVGGIRASSVAVHATDTSVIDVYTGAASIAGSYGNTAVSVAIGVSLARNEIGNDVAASILDADQGITATTGDILVTATGSARIRARSQAAAIAVAVGNIGAGISGAGAEATNVILTKTNATVDSSVVHSAGNVGLHATSGGPALFSLSSLRTTWAADLDAHAGGTLDESNQVTRDLRTLFAQAGATLAAGDLTLSTLATGSAWQLADSDAVIYQITKDDTGAVRVSRPMIIANVLAAAVGIGGGGAGGLGISIGASVARNLIGWKAADDTTPVPAEVRATVSSSSIDAAGALEQTATSAAGIDATVFAGSVAISTGTLGASLGGAGASSVNKIATRIEATIDGSGAGGVRAASISLDANDASVIVASTGSAALAASFTGSGGLSLAIGVGLAENRITNEVTSGIRSGANVSTDARFTTASGAQTVTAGDRLRVDADYVTPAFTTDSGARHVSSGQRVELLAGFDEAALDTASGDEELFYGTAVRVLSGYAGGGSPGVYRYVGTAGSVSLGSENYFDTARWARLGGTAGSVYAYVGTPGLIDLASQNYADTTRWAKIGGQPNGLYRYVGVTGSIDLAMQDYGDTSRWVAVVAGGVTITASETAVIKATTQAASAAAGASFGAGVSLSGAGADATNSILNKVNAVVTNSSLTSAADISIAASDSSAIDARVASLSVAVAGGSVGIGLAIGASTAENTIGNGAGDRAQVRAIVTASDIDTSGDLDMTALSAASIAARVDAIAAAVAGGSVGLAGSAAGTSVINTVSIQVLSAIADSTADGGVHADGGIALDAADTSTITASGLAASVAASVGVISGALAIGVAVAENEISNDVEAYVAASTVTTSSGALSITAAESATISSSAQAAAVAISNGPAFSGGGADVTGTITTTVKAYVAGSTVTLGGGLTLAADDTSRATAEVRTTSVAAGGLGFAAAGSTSSVTVSPTLSSTVSGSTIIAAGDVTLSAVSKAFGNATAEGNSFGTTFAAGGSVASSTLAPTVTTSITGGSVTSTGGGISLVSRFNAAEDGSSASTSAVPLGGMATAEASAGSLLLGGGGGRATSTTAGSITASAGGTLSAATGITVLSVSYARPEAEGKGLAVGGLAGIGIALASATSRVATSAAVTGSVTKAANLSVQSIAVQAPNATTTAVSGGIVAGNGSEATATVENQAADKVASAASLGSGSITVSGAVSLSATYSTGASAEAKGGAYGGVGIGASIATTRVGGDVAATVADNAAITAGSLTLTARRQLPGDASSDGAYANATASAGGLIGVTGSSATAAATGKVTAATGSNVSLPISTVTISAQNETRQHAKATGKAGGIVAVGSNSADATSAVIVSATLGTNPVTSSTRTGDVEVTSQGIDHNVATTIAGSGGVVAGSASSATTHDSSTVTTTISGTSSQLTVGSLIAKAVHQSHYAATADSTNAAALGASGANARATSTATATTILAPGVSVLAGNDIVISAANEFYRTPNAIDTVKAAGGGGATATAASSVTTFSGTSRVEIGDGVRLVVAATPLGNEGIQIGASSAVAATDSMDLQTGGALTGAGLDASQTINATNEVVIGNGGTLTSTGNIAVGTHTRASASTEALVNTWGLAAVGTADASTRVTTTQTVTVGTGSLIEAFGNARLTAGSDPTGGFDTLLQGSAVAQGYVRGLIAVPDAEADAILTSNASLAVGAGTRIRSGQNTTIAARRGQLNPAADGTGRGYQLGFIPVTVSDSNPSTAGTGTVTMNGSVEAGIYHTLDITIPNSGNSGIFSRTITVAPGGVPFVSAFDAAFSSPDFAAQYFEGTDLQAVNAGTSSTPVGAFRLGALYASGGTVTVDTGVLTGSGSVTANGTPTITIRNQSPDYLILGDVTIPNLPGGKVLFTGGAQGGVTVQENNPGVGGGITITNSYDGTVGNTSYGPALFLVGDVENLGGVITITNTSGSFFQAGGVFGQEVNVSVPSGAVVISLPSDKPWIAGAGNPYTEWQGAMIWPGGAPTAGVPNADHALAWVINSQFSAYRSSDDTLTRELIHFAGNMSPDNRSFVYYGGGAAFANAPALHADTRYARATALSPVGRAIVISNSDFDKRWFAVVPVRDLEKTATSYASANLDGSRRSSAVYGGRVNISGATIDINTKITAGTATNWSLSLPASLKVAGAPTYAAWDSLRQFPIPTQISLATYQTQYLAGRVARLIDVPLAVTRSGDSQIKAQYDAATNQIIVKNVTASSGGGFVRLHGGIMSTNTLGNIRVNGGLGDVAIDNQTGVPVVVQTVYAGSAGLSGEVTARVEIIDTYRDRQTIYVNRPGIGTETYDGEVNESADMITNRGPISFTSGAITTYSPLADQRWAWTLKASMNRSMSGGETDWAVGNWQWSFPSGQPNNPWSYVQGTGSSTGTTPSGRRIIGSASDPVFKQTISGTSSRYYDSWTISYGPGNFGFALQPEQQAEGINRAYWRYYYPNNGRLTMEMSVKADNPIGVEFTGRSVGSVSIVSNAPVILGGQLFNPDGSTTIRATSGSITATDEGSISARALSISASGGIGSTTGPLAVTLSGTGGNAGTLTAAGGKDGVFLSVNSAAEITQLAAETVSGSGTTYGDVSITAVGSLIRSAAQSASLKNVRGRDISITSTTGAVGSLTAPLVIDAVGPGGARPKGGIVTVHAAADIGIEERTGDLVVGAIASSNGTVIVRVPGGAIIDASGQTAVSVLDDEQIQSIWSRLNLMGSDAEQNALRSVAAFETQVQARYAEHWRLLLNGTVGDGEYTLSAAAIPLYRPRAAAALGLSSPTDEQVRRYAAWLYTGTIAFFDNAELPADAGLGLGAVASPLPGLGPILGADWRTTADFTAFNASFSFTATAEQQLALTENAVWQENELRYAVNNAVFGAASSTPVGIGLPTVAGRDVTIVADGGIGVMLPSLDIALTGMQSGTLTAQQKAALLLANTPGDALLYGISRTSGQTVTFSLGAMPADVDLVGIRLSQFAPLFVSVLGKLDATAGGAAFLQSTSNDLSIERIVADGEVRITAPQSILTDGGTAARIITPGDLRLVAGSGEIASAAAPLVIDVGGTLTSASAGGSLAIRQLAGDITFDRVFAGSAARMQAPSGALRQRAAGTGITAHDVALEALTSIGTSTSFIEVKASGAAEAVADQGVFMRSVGGLNLANIDAQHGDVVLDIGGTAGVDRITVPRGLLSLFADGAILDRRDVALTPQPDTLVNVTADRAILRAMTGVGTAANWLETTFNRLEARSFADMWIKNYGDMTVGGITSDFGGMQSVGKLNLTLASTLTLDEAFDSGGEAIVVTASEGLVLNAATRSGGGAISFHAGTFISLSANATIDAESGTPAVSLTADNGGITMAHGSSIDGAGGTVELTAIGDVAVTSIISTGDVSVTTSGGSILDVENDGLTRVAGRAISLNAPLGRLGTVGADFIVDTAAPASGGRLSVGSRETVFVAEATGGLGIGTVSSAEGDVRLTATETAAHVESMLLFNGSSIAAKGAVLLRVGGDFDAPLGSTITAGTTITIAGDYDAGQTFATDPATTFNIFGQLVAPQVTLDAYDDGDVFNIGAVAADSPLTVQTSGAASTFNVSSDGATALGTTAGLEATLTLRAGAGANRLVVSDVGGATSRAVTITTSAITGIAGGVIHYASSGGQFLDITGTGAGITILGSGTAATSFAIQSTLAGSTMRVVGGVGDDSFTVTDAGVTSGIAGALAIEAGAGAANRLTIDDSASSSAGAVIVTGDAIEGLSGGTARIDYAATGGSFTNGPTNDGILIRGATAAATYAIRSTLGGSTTKVVAGAASDTFTLGHGGVTSGIAGRLTIDAAGGAANRLVIDDSSGTGAEALLLTAASVSGLSGATARIDYAATGGSFTNGSTNDGILVKGSATAGTYAITSTLGGSTVKILAGDASDVFTVTNTGTVGSVAGRLTIDAGGGAANRLTIDDSAATAATAMELSAGSVSGLSGGAAAIHYSTTGGFTNGAANDGILVKGGIAANAFAILGTLAGSTTKVVGNAANDTFTVTNAGRTSGVAGRLTIAAGSGTANRLVVDDSASTSAEALVVTNGSIEGLSDGTARIDFAATTGNFTNGLTNDGILIRGGAAAGTYAIRSTLAGSTTRIATKAAAGDVVTVSDRAPATSGGVLTGIAGTLTISNAAGRSSVVLDASGDPVSRPSAVLGTETIGSETFGRLTGQGNSAPIFWSTADGSGRNPTGAVAITLGTGGNTLVVNQTHAAGSGAVLAYSITAGAGTDTLVVSKYSGNATYALHGFTNLVGPDENLLWRLNGPDSGSMASFTFTANRNLFGGTLRDVFQFTTPTASISGRIDGGAGSNWLDYRQLATRVDVNLKTGVVARVTRGVTRIDNVIGSGVGGDRIYGSNAGGVLIATGGYNMIQAGNGRSIIIGGIGKNTLLGGRDDDIIIDGRTSLDTNHAALDHLRSVWQNRALTTAQRRAALQSAASPFSLRVGATVFLTPDTQANRGPRLLVGNGGASWYFTVNAVKLSSYHKNTDTWTR